MEINIAKNSGFCFRINRALRIAKKARIRETEESMGPAAKNLNQIINKILPHTNAIQKANQFIQKRLTGAKKKGLGGFFFPSETFPEAVAKIKSSYKHQYLSEKRIQCLS